MKIFLVLFLLSFTIAGFGQEYLYFKKKNSTKIKRLDLMQKAAVKDKRTGVWTKGYVTAFSDSSITIDDEKRFHLKHVESVRFGKGGWKFLGYSFRAGGGLFAGIVLVNGLVNKDSIEQMSGPLGIAVAMYAVGWGFELLSRKGYSLEKFRVEYVVID